MERTRRSFLSALLIGLSGCQGISGNSDNPNSSDGFNRPDSASNSEFNPGIHGFGFRNWTTGDNSRFPDHPHNDVTEKEIEATIEKRWKKQTRKKIGKRVFKSPFIKGAAKQIYVSLNQGSATNGHCYGMAASVQDYYEDKDQIPVDVKNTNEIPNPVGDYATVGKDIDITQTSQYLSFSSWTAWRLLFSSSRIKYRKQFDIIKSVINKRGTAGVSVGNTGSRNGHQLLGYDYEESKNEFLLHVYEPNLSSDAYRERDPKISFQKSEGDWSMETYDGMYNRMVYSGWNQEVSLKSIVDESPDKVEDKLVGGIFLVRVEGSITLSVVDSEGVELERDRSEYMDRDVTEYDRMRYRYGPPEGEYQVSVTGDENSDSNSNGDGEYTLEIYGATDDEVLIDRMITDTVSQGETDIYTVIVSSTSESSALQDR